MFFVLEPPSKAVQGARGSVSEVKTVFAKAASVTAARHLCFEGSPGIESQMWKQRSGALSDSAKTFSTRDTMMKLSSDEVNICSTDFFLSLFICLAQRLSVVNDHYHRHFPGRNTTVQ